MNRRIILFAILGILFLSGIGLSVFLVRQSQDIRSNAQSVGTTGGITATVAPTTGAACQAPQSTANVHINYPHCEGALPCTADLNKADCTWDAVTGATSYKIDISQLAETGAATPVKSDTVASGTTYTFDVVPNNTYECKVTPSNSCGDGAPNAISLLCAAGITAPTSVPIATLVPSLPPPTAVPIQQLPKTGSTSTTMLIALGGGVLVLLGGALLLGF
jgi:LPXTG-motif cell wall-anchored protein